MSDLLNPANLIVLAVIAVGMFFAVLRLQLTVDRNEEC